MIKNLLRNWKTTAAGLTMISLSTIHLVFQIRAGTADENAWSVAALAVIGGLGLLFAGDSSQSIQQPPSKQ